MTTSLDESSPRYQALLQLLRTADTIWNASHAFFARWDLSPSQFNVLNLLHLTPEGVSQSELGRQLIMHRSNVTGLVDRLEKRGWVERHDVAEDRRAYRVVLTPKGQQLLKEILPHYYAGAELVWGELPAERIAQITSGLLQVAQNAERVAAQEARRSNSQPAKQSQ
ncbi:MAG TPA: MarR family transcriptional regulator [Bacillota bacterium]|nr:MarR family transcriptional regulator [Bacillota bacterium]